MIAGHYILGTLDDEDVDWLVAHGRRRSTAPGERLTERGRPTTALTIVLDGELAIAPADDGARSAKRLGPGEILGGIGLLSGAPAAATVESPGEAVVLELPYAELVPKLEADTGFAARFYRAVAVVVTELAHDVAGTERRPADSLDDGSGSSDGTAGSRNGGTETTGEQPAAYGINTYLARDRLRRLLRRADPTHEVTITGHDMTIEEVARVARRMATVALGETARGTLCAAREVVEELAAQDHPVYGLTTNLGELKDSRLDDSEQPLFQRHVLLSHAAGIEPNFPSDAVRAIILARLNGMACGCAGVQPAVFDALLAMLNAGVHPIVPMRGSIGMSDLTPLAHLSLPLIGEGEVEYRGERMPAAQGLAAAGIELPDLGPKDALSLVSANSASVGHGALALCDSRRLLGVADIAAALSLEALGGHTGVLDQRVESARRFTGQLNAAQQMRALLEGSYLWTARPTLNVQDPISFRSAAQVHGAVLDVLALTRSTLETELNAACDNPMVLVDRREMVSTGNFHPAGISIAFDTLAIALAQLTSMATNRIVRLMDPAFTNLPAYLSSQPNLNVGLGVVQKTAAALNAEVRLGANPASLDYVPVAGSIEDHATMATEGVAKAARSIEAATDLFAIELLVAAQAIDLRGETELGAGTAAAFRAIRERVPTMVEDRLVASDIREVRALLDDGELLRAVSEAVSLPLLGRFAYESDVSADPRTTAAERT